VVVRTADGGPLSGVDPNARGNPDTPLSREEVASKFRRNAGDLLERPVTEGVLDALLDPGSRETGSLAVLARQVLGLVAGG
jgi:hypothetical protein